MMDEIQPDNKYTYKTVNGFKLPVHVYMPENITKDTPTAICIHGGGWHDGICDNTQWNGGMMRKNAVYFAKNGFIGIVISYRSIDINDETDAYALVDDCYDALQFIYKLYYVNKDNITIIGDSAGAHLTLCLEFMKDIRVKNIIACNPVTNCTLQRFAYAANSEEKRRNISPIYNLKHSTANFYVIHGTEDSIVDIEDSRKFSAKMIKESNICKLIEIQGAEHAFILYDYVETKENVDKYMKNIINSVKEERK